MNIQPISKSWEEIESRNNTTDHQVRTGTADTQGQRLRLVDKRRPIRGHIDEINGVDVPHRAIDGFQIVWDTRALLQGSYAIGQTMLDTITL